MADPVKVLAAIALLAGAAFAAAGFPSDDPGADNLTAKELRKYIEPYIPGIRDCYVEHAKTGDGRLRLELIIHHDGSVFKFGFAAPGVTARALPELDRCLRRLSATWHFPVRRQFTSAVVPFFFLRTSAPGTAPKMASVR